MKKVIVTILIFVFAATAVSYAGIYKSQAAENERYSGGIYSNPSVDSEGKDSGYGLFRSSAPGPGNRPGNGGGIGQEGTDAPLGDGIIVLVVCSAILIIVKVIVKKFKRKSISEKQEEDYEIVR